MNHDSDCDDDRHDKDCRDKDEKKDKSSGQYFMSWHGLTRGSRAVFAPSPTYHKVNVTAVTTAGISVSCDGAIGRKVKKQDKGSDKKPKDDDDEAREQRPDGPTARGGSPLKDESRSAKVATPRSAGDSSELGRPRPLLLESNGLPVPTAPQKSVDAAAAAQGSSAANGAGKDPSAPVSAEGPLVPAASAGGPLAPAASTGDPLVPVAPAGGPPVPVAPAGGPPAPVAPAGGPPAPVASAVGPPAGLVAPAPGDANRTPEASGDRRASIRKQRGDTAEPEQDKAGKDKSKDKHRKSGSDHRHDGKGGGVALESVRLKLPIKRVDGLDVKISAASLKSDGSGTLEAKWPVGDHLGGTNSLVTRLVAKDYSLRAEWEHNRPDGSGCQADGSFCKYPSVSMGAWLVAGGCQWYAWAEAKRKKYSWHLEWTRPIGKLTCIARAGASSKDPKPDYSLGLSGFWSGWKAFLKVEDSGGSVSGGVWSADPVLRARLPAVVGWPCKTGRDRGQKKNDASRKDLGQDTQAPADQPAAADAQPAPDSSARDAPGPPKPADDTQPPPGPAPRGAPVPSKPADGASAAPGERTLGGPSTSKPGDGPGGSNKDKGRRDRPSQKTWVIPDPRRAHELRTTWSSAAPVRVGARFSVWDLAKKQPGGSVEVGCSATTPVASLKATVCAKHDRVRKVELRAGGSLEVGDGCSLGVAAALPVWASSGRIEPSCSVSGLCGRVLWQGFHSTPLGNCGSPARETRPLSGRGPSRGAPPPPPQGGPAEEPRETGAAAGGSSRIGPATVLLGSAVELAVFFLVFFVSLVNSLDTATAGN
eukprot:CAMPEP_0204370880 /NCGR_PEP_ID=MMETSP0469-20131031/46082_1 /ASSEMBLY_ACC=CAM_ASM_000384 /TAXON_ID=2969 /ORGANISM="Oxyrrhis marina" /LENGTH=816 /DNA_ID=CAMNT_0051360887 /DNA_START=16 /DNA_END=2464 /DNA_ORIENTATION=-